MPSPYIAKIAKETGKGEAEVERLWNKAKRITSEEFGIPIEDFGEKEFRYTVGVIRNMTGTNEAVLDPSKFLESRLSAKEYLLEVATSGSFSIGNVIPPKGKKNEDDDEDDEEEEGDDDDEDDIDSYGKKRYTSYGESRRKREGAALVAATQTPVEDASQTDEEEDEDEDETPVGPEPVDISAMDAIIDEMERE